MSALVVIVATVLQSGSRVLSPEGEFTSVSFPLLARSDLNLDVEFVPLERLASSNRPTTDLASFSAVQSADSRVADLDVIRAEAVANSALMLVDGFRSTRTEFDFVVAGAYKWLLSPGGTAFMTMRPELIERTLPPYASRYAGDSPWESIYGAPLRLAPDARRFDLSPGWLAWRGTVPALQLLNEIGINVINDHNVGLSNSFLGQLGMEPTDSAIVSLDLGGML